MPYRLRMAAGIAVCARFVTLVVVFITLPSAHFTRHLHAFTSLGRLIACSSGYCVSSFPLFRRGLVLSAGGDKSYTGSFKHRVGKRILFCHISRQVGARKSFGPRVFSTMHGTRLDPPV